MVRLKIVVIVVGAALAYWGFREYRVSSGTSSDPADVALADLEDDPATSNNYVTVGKHWAVYPGCVYAYRESKYAEGGPKPSSSLKSFGLLALGALFVVGGIVWLFENRFRRGRADFD